MRSMQVASVITVFLALSLPVAGAGESGECETLPSSARKFHPGHYVSFGSSNTLGDLGEVAPAGLAGMQVRYLWKDLEPTQGVYDFAKVRADLAAAEGKNLQLVVMIEDKTFNGELPAPNYLRALTLENRNGGYTLMRWDPVVVERMNALTRELGNEVDCHPRLEGVALQESALSLDDKVLSANGYTPEKYSAALERILLSAAASLPHSQVFWYMNFLPGKQRLLAEIADNVAAAGVAMGGPDILPDNRALADRTYPFYAQFRDRMILFGSMQNDSYAHVRATARAGSKYWTLAELLDFARNELHVSYVFWNFKTWPKPADSYTWQDALSLIAAQPSLGPPGGPPTLVPPR